MTEDAERNAAAVVVSRKLRCDRDGRDGGCSRCLQKGIECARKKKDLQSLLDEQQDWRCDIEKDMQFMRESLSQITQKLNKLAEPTSTSEQPAAKRSKRQTPERNSERRGSTNASEIATEGLLSLAGQLIPERQSPVRGSRRPVLGQRTFDSPITDALLDSPSAGLRESNKGSYDQSCSTKDDMLSNGIVTLAEAIDLFQIYFSILDPHICYLVGPVHGADSIQNSTTFHGECSRAEAQLRLVPVIESVRASSRLLFAAILCVAALHKKSAKHSLFPDIYREFIRLAAIHAFSRHQTLDDIRALVVGSFWLNDISWTLVGTAVRIVTERHMHESYARWVTSAPLLRRKNQDSSMSSGHSASSSATIPPDNQSHSPLHTAYEETRLYYLIYIADHENSIPYRRLSMTRQHEGIRRAIEWLNECPWTNNQGDTRLIALVKMWEILHDAIDEIGSDSRTPLDELGLAYHARFQAKIEVWHNTWSLEFSNPNTYERCELDRQRLYAELFLHSLAFRADQGTLPILFPAQVTYRLAGKSSSVFQHVCFQADQRRIIAENAIRSSHAILELLANCKTPVSKLVGQTSYSHTMTTFAIVLLMKALKQFGDQAEQCHLRGSDLRSVLRSIDPAFQALVAGAECVADENILVSISTATKQSIDQLRNTIPSERQDLRSRHTQGYDNVSVFNTRHSSRSSPFMASYPAPHQNTHNGQPFPSFPMYVSAQDQQMQGQRSQATPLDGLNRESPFLSLGSLDGFDLLSGQIPLSGIGLFQDTALDTDFDISGATSMADTHPV